MTTRPMDGAELRRIRLHLRLSLRAAADFLGYEGPNRGQQISRMEAGKRPVPGSVARLLRAYESGYRPPDWGGDW